MSYPFARDSRIALFRFLAAFLAMLAIVAVQAPANAAGTRWTPERANQWYAKTPWPVGFNFIPAYAINQLEMWQADSFDPVAIDHELAMAEKLGFNTTRVFLHNLLWDQDHVGLLNRMDSFLAISDRHHIKVMFVLLDDCWDPNPALGRQRDPIPFTHNSGWVQAPGREILSDFGKQQSLKPYVQGVMKRFAQDRRVLMWDLYNEPGNDNHGSYPQDLPDKSKYTLQLMKQVIGWAREIDPSQPLTIGAWHGGYISKDTLAPQPIEALSPLDRLALEASDVITFHNYSDTKRSGLVNSFMLQFGRPAICTEYLARGQNDFSDMLPDLAAKNIGALHWGFVSGKTQTIYNWDSFNKVPQLAEPRVWHHDFMRADGTPYSAEEVKILRDALQVNQKNHNNLH